MPPLPALLGIARGPFLLLSLNTVLLAIALAWPGSGMTAGFLGEALLVLLAAVAAHVSVNAFNEHHDFRSGLDLSTQRTPFSGGSGTLPGNPQLLGAALWLGILSLTLTLSIGSYFVLTSPAWPALLLIGGLGCALILAYTPWLTRRPWLCLFAPGLAFGPLMLIGGQLALSGQTSPSAMLLSLAPLFLGNNLLLLNQLPDIDADRAAGRLTLPMCLSPRAILLVLGLQWALALLLPALLALLGWCAPGVALSLLLAPLALWTTWRCRQAELQVPALLPAMTANVAMTLLLPVLLAIGLHLN